MRLKTALLPLAVGILILGPAASANAATSGPAQVLGYGTLGEFGKPTAHVFATDNRTRLKGVFVLSYPDGTFATGGLGCISVDGDTGYVSGRIAASGGPQISANRWGVGNYVVIGVRDNGTGGPADRLNFTPGFTTDPGCAANSEATPVFSIVAGDFKVAEGA